MKVMVLVKATQDSEAGVMPTPTLLADMDKFNQELVKAGVMLAGEGLRPSDQGKRVQFSGRNRTVLDGPFTGADCFAQSEAAVVSARTLLSQLL